jgi:fatty acyl-ACP thioesterase B
MNGIKLENESAAIVTMLRGRFVENRFVFRQNFGIRSYEIGPHQTLTIQTHEFSSG